MHLVFLSIFCMRFLSFVCNNVNKQIVVMSVCVRGSVKEKCDLWRMTQIGFSMIWTKKLKQISHESNLTDIGNWRSHLGIECNELEIKTNR